jgi:hypothetical protein
MHDRVFVGGGLSEMAAAFFNKQRGLLRSKGANYDSKKKKTLESA